MYVKVNCIVKNIETKKDINIKDITDREIKTLYDLVFEIDETKQYIIVEKKEFDTYMNTLIIYVRELDF